MSENFNEAPAFRIVEVGWPSEEWQIDFASQSLVSGSGEGIAQFVAPRFSVSGDATKYQGIMTGKDSGFALDWSSIPVGPSGLSVLASYVPLYNPHAQGPFYSASGALLTKADRPFLGQSPLVQATGPYSFGLLRESPWSWFYAASFSVSYQRVRVDLPGAFPSASGSITVTGTAQRWPGITESHTYTFPTGRTAAQRRDGLVSAINSGSSLWTATGVSTASGEFLHIEVADWLHTAEVRGFSSTPTGQLVPQSFAGTLVSAAPSAGFDYGTPTFGDGEFVRFTSAPT